MTVMTDRLLDAVRVWDGARELGTVRIRWSVDERDGTIVELAQTNANARYSVIPGLIDTHVHLIGNASSTPADFLTWPLVTRPEEQVLHGLANARRGLEGGVTTLRDLAADEVQFSLKRALDANIVAGPRLYAHGVVNMTGGHADRFIPAAVTTRKPVADGPDACRALVRFWARAGSDGIKVPVSGGVLSDGDRPATRNYTDAEIAAIVDEAHALGMPVAAHAHTESGIATAIRHGVDSIEHATELTPALAAEIVDAGIRVAPTLLINDRIAGGHGASAEAQVKARALVERRDVAFRDAAAHGVSFVLGTDANGFHVQFGEQMEEVRAMARVFDWTPARALEASTSRAAAVLGAQDQIGTLAVGSKADFLVMRGCPWENLDDLRPENLVAVISKGRVAVGALPADMTSV